MSAPIATVTQNCLIDLHLHLDGSISVPMARRLAELGNVPLPSSDEELYDRLSVDDDCHDLNEYLDKFELTQQLLQTREQLCECMRMLEEDLSDRGYVYAEIRFAPQRHQLAGLTQRQAVEAVLEGLAQNCFECNVILCCMRGDDTHEANFETIRLAAEYLGRGVVAVDLAGAEALFPTEDFLEEFALARRLGVPLTIHAGEAAGAQSVRTALTAGSARIGHGVRAVEDRELLAEIAQRHIALETCPSSEVQTCVYDTISSFPLRTLLDAGVMVTVNSDNMGVSATDVRRELRLLAKTFDLSDADVRQLLVNAARASFASDALKDELVRCIDAEFSLSE